MESRLTGDETGSLRWTDTATELVELARATATKGEDGGRQDPEGRAWLARAEADGARATSGPDVAACEKAVAAFGYGDVYEQARCQLRLAEAKVAAERRDEAAEHARVVREVAVRLGAVPLRDSVEQLVRRARLADISPAPGGVPVLTSRENDVLRLLAQGRTNRQIGEKLFISGKTASVHVSDILAELGAASRTEAVTLAYRGGLIEPGTITSG